ncbi:hypothetical protein CS369_19565 [Candidatus Symbiopectobacterium sp. 'North America']|uniref:DUF1127 domain-containing protein n=1 Tax=Candidatus Symbiopectobacterium sp. 'North America' TaxID=2794574 RepID=UPI0018CB5CDB|nr:DUF1127 domain-containing protein [Candidatus Symbiopectobacterium sp. 'North America']MBG6246379.1 hypothetical protein [Candidatus Symbiopectobacterium sp. 'North America']
MNQWRSSCKTAITRSIDITIRTPFRWWCHWLKLRTTLRELRRLNDAKLKDIGLTAHDVDRFR